MAANHSSIIPREILTKRHISACPGHAQWLEFPCAYGIAHRLAGVYLADTAWEPWHHRRAHRSRESREARYRPDRVVRHLASIPGSRHVVSGTGGFRRDSVHEAARTLATWCWQ